MNVSKKAKGVKTAKDEAVNKIILGTAIKLIPLILLGLVAEAIEDSSAALLIALIVLGLFVQGYIVFVRGTLEYAQAQGRNALWGWFGLFSLCGLPILILLPGRPVLSDRQGAPAGSRRSLGNSPFTHLNLVELLLFPFVAAVALYMLGAGVAELSGSLTTDQIVQFVENSDSPALRAIGFGLEIVLCLYFAQKVRQSGVAFKPTLGRFKAVRFKQILLITIVDLLFAISAFWLSLYGISFVAPGYFEEILGQSDNAGLLGWVLGAISAIVIAPLMEEFVFRGLVIHKLELKWGLWPAMVASSFLFAIVHVRFDVVPLFLMGLLYAFFYVRTASLWPSICCHAAYNFCITGLSTVSRLSNSESTPKSTEALVETYQQWVQSGLWWMLPMLCASGAYLGYWLWKMKPDANSELPYFVNESRSPIG